MRERVHARHLHVPALEAPAHVVRYSGIPCALCTYLAILRDARVVHLGPELTQQYSRPRNDFGWPASRRAFKSPHSQH